MPKVQFRFYEELNDYLPPEMRKVWFDFPFREGTTMLQAIQTLGIPKREIDLILVNQQTAGPDYKLQKGDKISVYPVFETFDISEISHLNEKPLRTPCFICDVHLGKLCKFLRMLGFDTLYSNQFTSERIIEIAQNEKRIILSKNIELVRHKAVKRAVLIHSEKPLVQIRNVVHKLQLEIAFHPLSRCLKCNHEITSIEKEKVSNQLKPGTSLYYHEFFICPSCHQIYWKGSHFENMLDYISKNILGKEPNKSKHE